MKLMKVKLPQGLNVKSAVFCAIDGKLAGIFALSYTLPETVFPALEALLLERVEPVLATRDFNLIPSMLQQRFKLAVSRMAFPGVERRRELSDPEREHDGELTALLCRGGHHYRQTPALGHPPGSRPVLCRLCSGDASGRLSYLCGGLHLFVSFEPSGLYAHLAGPCVAPFRMGAPILKNALVFTEPPQ